jgi:hypothetical protein
LGDPAVRAWYDRMALDGSRKTADVNLRRVGLFLHHTDLSFEKLLSRSKNEPGAFRDTLVRFATDLEARGLLSSYIRKVFVGVKNLLRFHEIPFDNIPRPRKTDGASLVDERVPTPEEFQAILETLPLRGQVTALFMAHAGLRPGVLSSYGGGDALRLRDVPELDIPTLEFRKIPFLIRVPKRLSKNGREYYTFGTARLAGKLLQSLRERRLHGRTKGGGALGAETLTPDSPVVAAHEGASVTGFVTAKSLTDELRDGIRQVVPAGVTWRPYVLRCYFSTRLWEASTYGVIDRDSRELMLGHDLGVSGRYNLSKRLDTARIERLRESYAKAAEYLGDGGTSRRVNQETLRLFLIASGFSEAEAAKEVDLTPEKVIALIREAKGDEGEIPPEPTRSGENRVVRVATLESWLARGWEAVAPAGADRFVVRAPATRSPRGPAGPDLTDREGGGVLGIGGDAAPN